MNRGSVRKVQGVGERVVAYSSFPLSLRWSILPQVYGTLGEHHNRIHATLKIEAKIHVNPSNKPSKVI